VAQVARAAAATLEAEVTRAIPAVAAEIRVTISR
jgi:hypothetical protein